LGGYLVARDIDRDGNLDLIWLESARRDSAVIWLNQGEGNFAEVSDNAPYSSELDGLFNTDSSPDKRSARKRRKHSSLVPSSFSDLGLTLGVNFPVSTVQKHSVATVERVADRLTILTHIRKRGPPSILS
jgi:hypothetical protein